METKVQNAKHNDQSQNSSSAVLYARQEILVIVPKSLQRYGVTYFFKYNVIDFIFNTFQFF